MQHIVAHALSGFCVGQEMLLSFLARNSYDLVVVRHVPLTLQVVDFIYGFHADETHPGLYHDRGDVISDAMLATFPPSCTDLLVDLVKDCEIRLHDGRIICQIADFPRFAQYHWFRIVFEAPIEMTDPSPIKAKTLVIEEPWMSKDPIVDIDLTLATVDSVYLKRDGIARSTRLKHFSVDIWEATDHQIIGPYYIIVYAQYGLIHSPKNVDLACFPGARQITIPARDVPAIITLKTDSLIGRVPEIFIDSRCQEVAFVGPRVPYKLRVMG